MPDASAHELVERDRQVAPLPVGTPAPDFALPQTLSNRVALHGLLGHPVVLVFYPLDWEPLSRDQLVLYQKFADEFARLGARLGARLSGISVDSVYCHAAFAHEVQLRFPLLADFQPHGGVARQYGVYREGQGSSARPLCLGLAGPNPLQPGVSGLLQPRRGRPAHDA